jgi:hypothetical protein
MKGRSPAEERETPAVFKNKKWFKVRDTSFFTAKKKLGKRKRQQTQSTPQNIIPPLRIIILTKKMQCKYNAFKRKKHVTRSHGRLTFFR